MRGDDELSDAERRRLAEIESSLRAEDPDFEQRRMRLRRHRHNVLALTGISAAVIFVAVNVLVDLSYAWLDPRIRYG